MLLAFAGKTSQSLAQPKYQTPMYSSISGRISPVAPRVVNNGRIVNSPRMEIAETAMNPNPTESVVRRRACRWSPRPTARETQEDAPVSKPMPIDSTSQMTGRAKLAAASASSPSREMKNRSTASNEKIASSPAAMGTDCRRRCPATGPVVSVWLMAYANATASFRRRRQNPVGGE